MKGNVFLTLEIICPAGCGRLRASRSLPHINSGGKAGQGPRENGQSLLYLRHSPGWVKSELAEKACLQEHYF